LENPKLKLLLVNKEGKTLTEHKEQTDGNKMLKSFTMIQKSLKSGKRIGD